MIFKNAKTDQRIIADQTFIDRLNDSNDWEVVTENSRPVTDVSVLLDDNGQISTMRGELFQVTFTSELPPKTYFMPLVNHYTGEVEYIPTTVNADGSGVFSTTFEKSGLFYIKEDALQTDLLVNGGDVERFSVYVGRS